MDLKEGDVLAGKYRIERVLGRGGMGVVVAATHLQLERRVAVKFLLPEAVDNPETIARFAREARAAARLRSEHVARVIDVGTFESGAPYMVMEYLDGADLAAHMSQRGPLRVAEAAELILQACEALAEAHAAGIVHRDLKPANLFLARYADGSPCLKILDFGISKVARSSTSGADAEFDMTRTAAVMGTPYYMSPEQMRSTREVDGRTDIWSLGVILYELTAGQVPFHALTLPQLCAMVLSDPPHPLRSHRLDVPAPFEALVMRCLEKSPSRRYQKVADLAAALAEFAPKHAARALEGIARVSGSAGGATSDVGHAGSERPAEPARSTHAGWGRTSATGPASRRLWLLLVALLLLVVGAGAVLLGRQRTLGERTSARGALDARPPPPSVDTPPPTSAEARQLQFNPAEPGTAPAPPPSTPSSSAGQPSSPRPIARPPAGKLGKHGASLMHAPVTSTPAPVPAPPSPKTSPNPLDGRL